MLEWHEKTSLFAYRATQNHLDTLQLISKNEKVKINQSELSVFNSCRKNSTSQVEFFFLFLF